MGLRERRGRGLREPLLGENERARLLERPGLRDRRRERDLSRCEDYVSCLRCFETRLTL